MAQQLQPAATVEFLGLLDANPVRDTTTGIPARDTLVFDGLKAILPSLVDDDHPADVSALADPRVSALLGDIPTRR